MAAKRTPQTPKKARARKNRTRDWTPDFLAAFRETGLVKEACERAQVGRSTVYQRRETDEEFASAWRQVEDETTEEMEREARRRAVDGVHRKFLYDSEGNEIGFERQFSDTLLIFLLKARKPKTYRDNVRHEHTGPGGGPVVHALDTASPKVRKHLDAALAASAEAERGAD